MTHTDFDPKKEARMLPSAPGPQKGSHQQGASGGLSDAKSLNQVTFKNQRPSGPRLNRLQHLLIADAKTLRHLPRDNPRIKPTLAGRRS